LQLNLRRLKKLSGSCSLPFIAKERKPSRAR
jgi:hypothetical protein